MIPQTVVAVVVFALLVVPGLAFELLRQTRRPAFDQTALEEIGRVVLASAAFGSAAFLVLVLVSVVEPGWLIDLGAVARHGSKWYWERHPALVLFSVGFELVLATLFALLVHRSLNHGEKNGYADRALKRLNKALRHKAGQQIERFPIWRTVFRDNQPPGAFTKITVLKKDGTLVMGSVAGYSANGVGDERDLALSQPITIRRPGDATPREVPGAWKLLLLANSEIAEIYVTWPASDG